MYIKIKYHLPYFSEPPQQKAYQVFLHSTLCQIVRYAVELGEGGYQHLHQHEPRSLASGLCHWGAPMHDVFGRPKTKRYYYIDLGGKVSSSHEFQSSQQLCKEFVCKHKEIMVFGQFICVSFLRKHEMNIILLGVIQHLNTWKFTLFSTGKMYAPFHQA